VAAVNANFWDVFKHDDLDEQYRLAKSFLQEKKPPPDVESASVFANAELDLAGGSNKMTFISRGHRYQIGGLN